MGEPGVVRASVILTEGARPPAGRTGIFIGAQPAYAMG